MEDLKDVSANGATVTIALPAGLPPGTHLLSWRVVSADGHPVSKTIKFTLTTAGTGSPVSPSVGQSSGSQGGDSGALIVEAGTRLAVGLLFAGTVGEEDHPERTYAHPIRIVLETLDVELWTG